jgi:hypothetical protein
MSRRTVCNGSKVRLVIDLTDESENEKASGKSEIFNVIDLTNDDKLVEEENTLVRKRSVGSSSSKRNTNAKGILEVRIADILHPYHILKKFNRSEFAHYLVGHDSENFSIEYVDDIKDACRNCVGMYISNCVKGKSLFDCVVSKIFVKKGQSREDEIWTIAHEIGHFCAHRSSHFYNSSLGSFLEEGFAQTFAMIALPEHPKSLNFKAQASLPSESDYLSIIHNSKFLRSDEIQELQYDVIPTLFAKRLHEFGTVEDIIDYIYARLTI